MTGLLVSVRSAAEARTALAGGAHLIDVKEPRHGSLGAAAPRIWLEVAEAVAGAVPLSAALGELLDPISPDASFLPAEFQFAKLGLSDCARLSDWPRRWSRALSSLTPGVVRVAVVYADWRTCHAPEPSLILEHGARLGCRALLIDTFDKSRGNLFEHLPPDATGRLLQSARDLGLQTVLAGSLTASMLLTALALEPDFVAVRGAVCGESRTGDIDERRVRQFATMVGESPAFDLTNTN